MKHQEIPARNSTNSMLPAQHPLRRVAAAMRAWLGLVVVVLGWNAVVANHFVIGDVPTTVMFIACAVIATVWLVMAWHPVVTVVCSSLLAVLLWMRGLEVALFADEIDIASRATATSVWLLVGATSLVFGFLSLVAISRRNADLMSWGRP